jgi:hypothetical protein
MTLNYINNIIKENNLFLNYNHKKNNNLFLKEFDGTYNQNSLAKPLMITEDKFVVYSTSNKFNSFLVKRKHVYKRGLFSSFLFAKAELKYLRIPNSFLFRREIAFIGKSDEKNDILLDTQYYNNLDIKYYKRLRKILIKGFYRGEKQYLWRKFMKKYNLIFSLDTLKAHESTKLFFSQTLLEKIMFKCFNNVMKYNYKLALKRRQKFPIYPIGINHFGFKFIVGKYRTTTAFAFFDRVLVKYLKMQKSGLIMKQALFLFHNIFYAKLVRIVSWGPARRGRSNFIVRAWKSKYTFLLKKIRDFKNNNNKFQVKSLIASLNLKKKMYKFNKYKNFNKNNKFVKFNRSHFKYPFYTKPKKYYLN